MCAEIVICAEGRYVAGTGAGAPGNWGGVHSNFLTGPIQTGKEADEDVTVKMKATLARISEQFLWEGPNFLAPTLSIGLGNEKSNCWKYVILNINFIF